ncbi:Asp/Glu/Hydantoin racemase [Vibrio ruber DSM 16370]|uniref:Hydantoin racemase n=1 Tax=Vibrio ruber (strain DSM 16370 / JCM 11486 / BCRC 17186 / CECT 7878 / LMG 23124 / VR1) TaxID=1123498 RepID=A0A1R4LAV4_VIBR1|nr:aspartate/glutamate racemase family protein [Vibrio ruber]SJN53523.1 Asp/Glu/Hydantoin racemase [Vibrio ruber DSM 16370]
MRILVVNPNTTASMTEKACLAARQVASESTEIIAVTSAHGPVSIEGYYDEAMSVPGMLQAIQAHQDFDAVVIACFDDTGLDAARCITDKPVIGIGEAAYRVASMLANKFSVVTTLSRSVPALEHNLLRYGMERQCIRVRASDIPVLELERDGSEAAHKIAQEIELAIRDDRAEAIVLGCAGMVDLAERLSAQFSIPVLDGVTCAVSLCESLVRLKVKTTRQGGYAPPPTEKMTASALHATGCQATD